MNQQDGGPAFPRPMGNNGYADVEDHDSNSEQEGMSLRDYFAAKAMHAELVTAGALPDPAEALSRAATEAGQTIVERIAFNSYQLADAMLAERAKSGGAS